MAASQSGLGRIFGQIQSDDWIGAALERVYAAKRAEHWEPPTLEVHPSSAGSVCARDIQLYMLGHRTPIQAKNLRRMNNGTAAHDRWNRYFADAGILGAMNIRHTIADEWSGEFDVLAKHPLTGKLVLVELKTMNERRYRNVPAQHADLEIMGRILAKVEQQYVRQLIQYYVHFRLMWPTNVADEVAFLFENTNDQDFVVRYWKPTTAMILDAFVNSNRAREASIRGSLLEPPYQKLSPTCRKCYREAVCYSLQRGDPEPTEQVATALNALEEARIRVNARLVSNQRDFAANAMVEGSGGAGGGAEDGLPCGVDGPGHAGLAGRGAGDPFGEERPTLD